MLASSNLQSYTTSVDTLIPNLRKLKDQHNEDNMGVEQSHEKHMLRMRSFQSVNKLDLYNSQSSTGRSSQKSKEIFKMMDLFGCCSTR